MIMENGHVGGWFRPLHNTQSNTAPPKEPVVLLSGRNLPENNRPDIRNIGFRTIEQINPSLDDANREYFLDSDLETIQEESSVLESDIDERMTPYHESTCTESEISYGTMNGDGGSTTTLLSSSSSSPQSQTVSFVPDPPKDQPADFTTHNKIIYAKCLSPEDNQFDDLQHLKDAVLSHHMNSPRGRLPPETNHSPAVTPIRDSNASRRNSELKMSDMFQAVTRGDIATLSKFSQTEQCETLDERGNTLLHLAATAGQLQCVQFLMNGPLVDAISIPNDELMTPTALAVMRGHLQCVQWMVENTAARKELIASSRQASIDGSSMRPPLPHVAARYNQDQVLDWLCEQMVKENYSVDSADYHSNTATHEAAAQGHLKSLQVLVGRGASVTVLNSNGDTPGQVADKNGQDLCVGYLVVVETCMSLAQQLIRVKLENEGLVKENCSYKTQLQSVREAKLAAARESVEDRIKATLQGISSCDEEDGGSETERPQIIIQRKPSPRNGSIPPSKNIVKEKPNVASPKVNQWSGKTAVPPPAEVSPVQQPLDQIKLDHPKETHMTSQKLAVPETEPPHLTKMQTTEQEQLIDVSQIEEHADNSTSNGNPQRNDQYSVQTEQRKDLTTILPNERPGAQTGHVMPAPSVPAQAVKAWERMAMDEVLRLSRDMRYLPSPTISVRTEDSTMESKEVMRDRMAEASRWFLVQQAGGKAHMKESKVSQRMRQPYSMNSFARPKNYPTADKPRPMVGPIHQGTKSGPMPAKIVPTNTAALSHSTKNSRRLPQQSKPNTNAGITTSTTSQNTGYTTTSTGNRTTAYRSNQIGSIASIRPSSAKSNTSSTSTLTANGSISSSPSTSLSGHSVIENTDYTASSHTLPRHNAARNKALDKDRLSASNSPGSVRSEKHDTRIASSPHRIQYSSTNINSSPQVTVTLPTRNNSFLRKVQPPSPTINRGKSPLKSNTPASSSVESIIGSTATSSPTSSPAKKPNYSSFAYFLPRRAPQEANQQVASPPMKTLPPSEDSPKKSSPSGKTSGRKRATKLFRF